MTTGPDSLEEVIRRSGEVRLIHDFAPQTDALSHVRTILADVDRCAKSRLGATDLEFSEAALLGEFARNPYRVKAFLQAIRISRNLQMLLMAWMVIVGVEIRNVEVSYQRGRLFRMRLVLERASDESEDVYESEDINDLRLLRHMGIMKVSGEPVLDGFYPLGAKT